MQVDLVRRKPWPTDYLGLIAGSQVSYATLALLLFGWMLEGVFTGSLAHFDVETRNFIHHLASPALTASMRLLSTIGSSAFLAELFVVFFVGFLLLRWREDAAWLVLTMAGSAVIVLTLKYSLQRPRPAPFFGTAPSSYSFPSGHAVASFCFFAQLAIVFTPRIRSPLARVLVWFAAAVLITGIGFSRIYLGVHYTTDVIAGYALAAAWCHALAIVHRSPNAGGMLGAMVGALDKIHVAPEDKNTLLGVLGPMQKDVVEN
jgi:membrane-associated phospholipid phosphatase